MARHRLSGVVLCTHLDGPARCEGLGATIYNMVQLNRTGGDTEIIDVYIGGGLCNSKDSQGTLKAIYVELLKAESPCAQQSNAGSEVFTVDSYLQLLDHVHNTILLPDSEGKSRPRSTGWGFLLQPSEDARTGVFNAIAQESTPPMVAVRSMLFPINCKYYTQIHLYIRVYSYTYTHSNTHIPTHIYSYTPTGRGPSDARGRRGAAAMSAPSMRPLMHQPVPAKAPVPDSLLGTYTTTDSASDSSTTTGSVSNASSASASGMQIQVLDFRVGMEASELPFLKQLLAVSDADLLAKTSSSPHCEPEHYVRELRLVLLAMLQKAEQEQEQEGSEENEDKLKAKGGGDTFVYRLIKGITWERIS